MSTLTGKDLNLVKPALTDDHKVTIGTDLPANFQKIDDEFTAHLAESASKHITESGSNENGSYIKFDDGTMICWKDYLGGFGAQEGALDSVTWTYPAAFISDPTISITALGSPDIYYVNLGHTSTQATIKLHLLGGRGNYIYALPIAIGSWK